MKDDYTPIPDIRIRVPDSMKRELKNVASHMGMPMAHILRPVLRKFLEEQPKHYKSAKYQDLA